MKLFVCAAFAVSLLVAEEPFEVKELDTTAVAKLTDAQAKVDAAMKEYVAAKDKLESSKKEVAALESVIKNPLNPYEGECVYPSVAQNWYGTANAVYISPSKKFRRVEIRGRYALITSGSESCGLGWYNITPTNGTTTLSPYGSTNMIVAH